MTHPFDGVRLLVGGCGGSELRQALEADGVGLNESARVLLARPEIRTPARQVHLVVRTVDDLGHPDGATLPVLLDGLAARGLRPCPLATGPALRLHGPPQDEAPDQVMSNGRAPSASVTVLSTPLSGDDTLPKGFYLRVVAGRAWLRGYRCTAEHVFAPEDLVAAAGDGAVGPRTASAPTVTP